MQASDPGSTEPTRPARDSGNKSPSIKRRRSSHSSQKSPEPEPSNVPSNSRGRRTLKQPPTEGSSRDTASMHRSPTPSESGVPAIRYTKTGRVSKATKGKRVHHCDECGKTYTRAEHLRRHQQNHKPGTFPCDVPGCGRSFYREDLLVRHKARHNDPLNPPSPKIRRASLDSQSSTAEPDDGGSSTTGPLPMPSLPAPATSVSSIVHPQLPSTTSEGRAEQPDISSTSKPRIWELPRSLAVAPVLTFTNNEYEPSYIYPGISPAASENGDYCEVPASGYYGPPYYNQPQPVRQRNFSDASYLGFYQPHTSRSPVSAGSSTTFMPPWSANAPSPPVYTTLHTSYGTHAHHQAQQHLISGFAFSNQRTLTPEQRDFMEQDDLMITSTNLHDLTLDRFSGTPDHEQRYLQSYWTRVHAIFPVLHKPSFEPETVSPLLRAAVLALGAQASGDRTDLSIARDIHEKCMKVLQKRTMHNTHSFRVCDMQAVLLVEIYSVFKSRRPPLQLSKPFEAMYQWLVRDPQTVDPALTDGNDIHYGFENYSEHASGRLMWQCKQRLLLSCYILDRQHATLFDRRPTPESDNLGLDLPFPSPQAVWDAATEQCNFDYSGDRNNSMSELVGDALRRVPRMFAPSVEPYDTFRSMLMLACLSDPINDMVTAGCASEDSSGMSTILFAMEDSARTKIAFHTTMLCKLVPLRDLLAVAGESWVMGEKLSNEIQYTQAQILVREWTAQPLARHALSHAFSLLTTLRTAGRTGLLYQEWSAYLASLVVWANFYAAGNEILQPSIRMSHSADGELTAHELDCVVAPVLHAGFMMTFAWNDTRHLLLWTKTKVERVDVPHTCGLVSGALDVLGKLVSRGNEDGWF